MMKNTSRHDGVDDNSQYRKAYVIPKITYIRRENCTQVCKTKNVFFLSMWTRPSDANEQIRCTFYRWFKMIYNNDNGNHSFFLHIAISILFTKVLDVQTRFSPSTIDLLYAQPNSCVKNSDNLFWEIFSIILLYEQFGISKIIIFNTSTFNRIFPKHKGI